MGLNCYAVARCLVLSASNDTLLARKTVVSGRIMMGPRGYFQLPGKSPHEKPKHFSVAFSPALAMRITIQIEGEKVPLGVITVVSLLIMLL